MTHMARANLVLRIFLGTFILTAGVNKFYSIMPMPEHTDRAGALLASMANSGYLLHLVGLTEIVCGVLLLSGRFVPLALVVLAPISVNVLLFALILDPGGLGPALALCVLHAALAMLHRDKFAPLFA